MREEMAQWIHQELQTEQENYGGEFILLTTGAEDDQVRCSLNCSEELALATIDHLVSHISTEGMVKLLQLTMNKMEAK